MDVKIYNYKLSRLIVETKMFINRVKFVSGYVGTWRISWSKEKYDICSKRTRF